MTAEVVELPARRWPLGAGLIVEARPVDDHHSAAIVRQLGHHGWVDVWAVGAELTCESRFANVLTAPTWPHADLAGVVDAWIAELFT